MKDMETLKAVQWTGYNLEEVINFVGKSPQFRDWFKSFEEYEKYVDEHDRIVKLFSPTGYNVEVRPGEWIVKLPDGTNVPVKNCWIKEVSQSKAPAELEEAAAAAMPKPNGIDSKADFSFFQMLNMFKAGAEWDRAKMMEQPEVDLEKEIEEMWNSRFNLGWDEHSALSMNHEGFVYIAHHFYELGLNARKEE